MGVVCSSLFIIICQRLCIEDFEMKIMVVLGIVSISHSLEGLGKTNSKMDQ